MKAGWATVRLCDLCTIARGGSPRPIKEFITDDANGINWIKIGDTERGGRYIDRTEERIKPEGVARSRYVKAGSFLLSNSMSFGRPYILRTDGCIHDGWLVLEPDYGRVDQGFLYHVLGSRTVFDQFDTLAAGSTVRNLNIGLVEGVTIPLPPLEEQQRIVAILDEAFEGLARARTHAEANLQNARELFESAVSAIFDLEIQSGDVAQLKDVTDLITKGSSPNWQGVAYVNEPGVLFVTSENVGTNEILLDAPKYVDEAFNLKDRKSILRNGDVLSNIVGASIGRTAVFDRDEVANINQAVCMIRCTQGVLLNHFLAYLLNSPYFKQQLHAAEVDNARANLSLTFFRDLNVPLPTFGRQSAIVEKIHGLITVCREIESQYQFKLSGINALRQSLLQKAFAGELT